MNCKCKLCNWEWVSRSGNNPKACPRCKRYDWNDKDKNN